MFLYKHTNSRREIYWGSIFGVYHECRCYSREAPIWTSYLLWSKNLSKSICMYDGQELENLQQCLSLDFTFWVLDWCPKGHPHFCVEKLGKMVSLFHIKADTVIKRTQPEKYINFIKILIAHFLLGHVSSSSSSSTIFFSLSQERKFQKLFSYKSPNIVTSFHQY